MVSLTEKDLRYIYARLTLIEKLADGLYQHKFSLRKLDNIQNAAFELIEKLEIKDEESKVNTKVD